MILTMGLMNLRLKGMLVFLMGKIDLDMID